MNHYTFTHVNALQPTNTVTMHFTAVTDLVARRQANEIVKLFHLRKEHCKLTRHDAPAATPKNPNPWRRNDPVGPTTGIPILINRQWFTPNGHPIHDIDAYKARCRQNALKKDVPVLA